MAECHGEPRFPLYAVHVSTILEMDTMLSHETLQPRVWTPDLGPLLFVSHQWTSHASPDPTGKQLRVLQGTLNRLTEMFASYKCNISRDLPIPIQEEDFSRLWVWLDWWSIPQAASAGEQRSHAIDSIPAYASAASVMIVLCPSIMHADRGMDCDFASWQRRGWCRLERLAFELANYSITSPAAGFVVHDIGRYERMSWSHKNLAYGSESIFHGEFTVEDDRQRLQNVVCDAWEQAQLRLKGTGQRAAWRKLTAFKALFFDGADCSRSINEVKEEESINAFLTRYEFASVNEVGETGMYPLHYAAYEDNARMVRELVAAGAHVNCRDVDHAPFGAGATPLYYAAELLHDQAVEALIQHGADVHQTSLSAPPILMTIVGIQSHRPANMSKMRRTIEMVLEAGVDVDDLFVPPPAPSCWIQPIFDAISGMSLLCAAARFGCISTARIFLKNGADPLKKCGDGPCRGLTAIDLARQEGHAEILALLLTELQQKSNEIPPTIDSPSVPLHVDAANSRYLNCKGRHESTALSTAACV